MRLHRLTLTAFGPFGGTQTIDFDRLSRDGLFLLHGPTGAGKTSVLDAVCFALYGSVPGARQSGQALRSDLADPLTLTEVVLELTVAERRLEITRLPEQPRPKKRGSGTTREKAQSRLREFVPAGADAGGAADGDGPADGAGGHWKALSRSHQEIGEEIGQLLGMSKEQFCQVVLLPQGDFARFLRADAEARSRLLGRLFDTRRFAALEEQLNARRKAAADTVTAGDERLLALAHRMAQAAGESADLDDPSVPAPERAAGQTTSGAPARGRGRASATTAGAGATATRATVPGQAGPAEGGGRGGPVRTAAGEASAVPGPGEPGFAEAVLVRAAVARVGARERLAVAHAAERAAEVAEQQAARRWEEARECHRLQQRYADAQQRAARLDAGAEERERTRERLERARAAAEVAPALALRDAAWHELDAAQRAERQSRSPLPSGLTDAESDQLASMERRLREDLGSLGAARRAERRAADIGRERTALDREARADERTLLEAAEWLAGWGEAQRAHRQRIETAQEAATRADQLGARIEPAAERWEAARRRDRLSADVRTAEAELLVARERSAAAHEHWLDLKDRRLRGIAAELADGLRDGQACAVCGATEHPAPARAGAGHVDRTAEEAALETHRRAEEARQQAEARCQSAKEALAAAAATAGDTPTEELAAEVEELRADFARDRALGADLPAARGTLDRAEREYEQRRAGQQQAERRAAARTSHREALDRERAALEEELTRARADCPSVADRAARLERQVALLAAAAEAARTADGCAQRLKDADAGLSDAAYRAGFDTPQAAAEACCGTTHGAHCSSGSTTGRPNRPPWRRSWPTPRPPPPRRCRPRTRLPPRPRTRPRQRGCVPPRPPTPQPGNAAPNSTGSPPAPRPTPAHWPPCAPPTTASPASPRSPPARPRRTSGGCGWSRMCSPPGSNRWRPPPRPGCTGCPPAATPWSTPTNGPAAPGAPASACMSSTPGPATNGTPPACPAARPSSPRSRWRSASPMSSPTRRAAPGWTPSSSTRGSAAWTNRPWTRCWTSWTHCANATAASASSAMSPTSRHGSPRSWRSSRTARDPRSGTAYGAESAA